MDAPFRVERQTINHTPKYVVTRASIGPVCECTSHFYAYRIAGLLNEQAVAISTPLSELSRPLPVAGKTT